MDVRSIPWGRGQRWEKEERRSRGGGIPGPEEGGGEPAKLGKEIRGGGEWCANRLENFFNLKTKFRVYSLIVQHTRSAEYLILKVQCRYIYGK